MLRALFGEFPELAVGTRAFESSRILNGLLNLPELCRTNYRLNFLSMTQRPGIQLVTQTKRQKSILNFLPLISLPSLVRTRLHLTFPKLHNNLPSRTGNVPENSTFYQKFTRDTPSTTLLCAACL